ncbi:MAG: carboxypeptidase-like regulatory domain-containing protein [Actinomycetota bacterium]
MDRVISFAHRRWLCCLALLTLILGVSAQAQDAAVQRVTVRGSVVALLRGEDARFRFMEAPGDLDSTRYFEVTFTDPDEVEPEPVARVRTDPDGGFTARSLPVGSYIVQVRIPTVAEGQDHGILYRGRVELKADEAKQELRLPVRFLYIRVQDADGKPFAWTTLRLGIHRTGGELDQRWGQVVFSRGGLEGPGGMPQPAGEGKIMVRLQKGGFSFSWSSKEVGAVIFPVVEEDQSVRYRMTLSVPGMGYKIQRFSAARDKSPAEVDCPMRPFSVIAGRVKLDGLEADLRGASLSLSVLDPEDDGADVRALQFASAQVAPDGSFRFPEVTAGLVQIAAEVVGKNGKQENVRGVTREWITLEEGQSRTDLPLRLAPRTFEDPAPGDIFVTVVEGAERTPVGRIKVELIPAGGKRGAAVVTSRDGRCSFILRRPRSYILRVTDLVDGKPVVSELPVSEEEVRRGVRKIFPLGKQTQVARA